MAFKAPNLDDRDFYQLVEEAKSIIKKECPQWTDLSPGDPGIVILEVFAHLTETMIYRLNRLPEKAYIEFLRLIGVKLTPPTAASVELRFSLSKPQDTPVEIPKGTRVTLARSGGAEPPPVFVVLESTSIPAGKTKVDATAYHCELVEGEIAGVGTDLPGLSVMAKKPPIVDQTDKELELIVGVEAGPEELGRFDVDSIGDDKKAYVVWREVEDFSNLIGSKMSETTSSQDSAGTPVETKTPETKTPETKTPETKTPETKTPETKTPETKTPETRKPESGVAEENQLVYVVDRVTGTITFAPALRLKDQNDKLNQTPQALGEVPKEGRQISIRYCSGGGLAGNVAAGTLTTLKDPIPGVSVTNPEPATGGRDVETLENALVRGPQQLHSLQRAVTARDFELVALRSSGAIARAKAYTKASLWKHATPGTVEVLVVPNIPEKDRPNGVVTEEALDAHQTDDAMKTVQQALDQARPLSTTCLVEPVGYKEVKVVARAVIHRGEDAQAVQARVLKRLHQTINPLPSSLPSTGWPFDQPLRVSHVYDIMLAEPSVSYVEDVTLIVDQVPNTYVSALAADAFQPSTWYATTKARLFRSMDNGEGWELIKDFPQDEITALIRVNNFKPGQIAVVTYKSDSDSRLYVSDDCGETWRTDAAGNPFLAATNWKINDLVWISPGDDSVLIMATDKGLFSLALQQPDSRPLGPLIVDKNRANLGFIAVAAAVGVQGTTYVAAATNSGSGASVYLSSKGGATETYLPLELNNETVSVLEVQQFGQRTYLWAGIMVPGNAPGKGAVRWELQGSSATALTPISGKWEGGSCHGLAFSDLYAFAASHDRGVLWLDMNKGEAATWNWRLPLRESGLKIREDDIRAFQPTWAVAAAPQMVIDENGNEVRKNIVMAGGGKVVAGGVTEDPPGFQGIYRSIDNGTTYALCSKPEFEDKVTVSKTWLFVSGDHEVKVVTEREREL